EDRRTWKARNFLSFAGKGHECRTSKLVPICCAANEQPVRLRTPLRRACPVGADRPEIARLCDVRNIVRTGIHRSKLTVVLLDVNERYIPAVGRIDGKRLAAWQRSDAPCRTGLNVGCKDVFLVCDACRPGYLAAVRRPRQARRIKRNVR